MSVPNLHARIQGCLLGAAIGAEMGWAKVVPCPEAAGGHPAWALDPVFDVHEEKGRVNTAKATPFVDIGVRAYVSKNGRVTPEDFAALLREDPALARPVWFWDGIHTVQELLKGGMHPRLSGHGVAPCGHIAAAMPAVGIYHFGDPQYAYLDGVEIASVVQPRLGADWAALAAAAVACALDPASTPETVVDTALKLAHQNNKELFYAMNRPVRQARSLASQPEEAFFEWWRTTGGREGTTHDDHWFAANPLRFVLPLLERYASDAVKMMVGLRIPGNNASEIGPILAGAIMGAMHGAGVFPAKWRAWAEPAAEKWYAITGVVDGRIAQEKEALTVLDRLTETRAGDGKSSPQRHRDTENAQRRSEAQTLQLSTLDSLLFDKVYGCMLAGAIGNAMGSPTEGQFYREIDARHPGGVRDILDPSRLESEDDNQMAMLLVETYLAREGLPVMARHFGQTWYDRLNRDHFYMNCMGNSYDLIRRGWDPRITGHWNVVTGSTVMCMEPVGIYHLADPDFAFIDATAISYMYQRGLDVTAAAILATTVAEAIRPEATVDSVCAAALKAAPREKMNTFDQRAFASVYDYLACCLEIADRYDDVLAVRAELCDRCLLYHCIDPLELLGFAFAMFKIARGDVRQAAIGGASIGRDADTIAGRGAMLAGLLRGASTVPAEWVAQFKPAALERIKRNSARLADFLAQRKGANLRLRQSIGNPA
jgi:ADP-ribosylglycohydrolase